MLALPIAAETTVYRSVNAQGVVVFSDQPPAAGTATDVLHIAVSPQSAADAKARLESLRASNDRLARARRAREAARAGSAAPAISYTAPVAIPAPPTVVVHGSRYPIWPPGPARLIYRGPLRHQPGAAPVPPGFKVIQPGNRQLMRPIVSSRD